jgi:hypothetical protein
MHLPASIEQPHNAQAADSASEFVPTEPAGWSAYDVWHSRIRLLPGASFLLATTSNETGN